MVPNVIETIDFYKTVLGFTLNMTVPDNTNPVWASLTNGDIEIMIQQKESVQKEFPLFAGKEIGGTFILFIRTENIQELYAACKKHTVPLLKDRHKTFYGTDEFSIQDINGYVLTFAQRI